MKYLAELLKQRRFIAIARKIPLRQILQCAEAVHAAGVEYLEVTFDPSDPGTLGATAEKVAALKKNFPSMRIGCGTVLTAEMVRAGADAGAEYIISPNTSKEVVDMTRKLGLLSIPGAFTPSEIVNAHQAGADIVKIFPVLPGQESYAKNVMTPLSHIPFIVTGGVTIHSIRSMLETGAIAAAAGASVFPRDLLEKGDYGKIGELAKRHLEAFEN